MPRSGASVYSKPAGTTPVDGDVLNAAPFNLLMDDIAADLNLPRPIAVGGTGATTSSAALVNFGLTATASELNILDGATLSVTELNYVDGVTSAIQTQIDTKAPTSSPSFTGTPLAPTAAVGTDTTQIATAAFVNRASGSAKFWFAYNQTGTAVVDGSYNIASMTDQGVGKFTFTLTNNMANADWSAIFSVGQKSARNVRVITGDGTDKTKATSGWGAGNANVSGTYQDDDALGGSGLGDLA
jgi:hypothetical protein